MGLLSMEPDDSSARSNIPEPETPPSNQPGPSSGFGENKMNARLLLVVVGVGAIVGIGAFALLRSSPGGREPPSPTQTTEPTSLISPTTEPTPQVSTSAT